MTSDARPNPSADSDESAADRETPRPRFATKPNIILLSSTCLMLAWKYFGTTEFYADALAERIRFGHPNAMAAFYQFGSCLVLLGVIPALIVKCVFRERLGDYGLRMGHKLFTVRSFLIAAPIICICGYVTAMDPEFRAAFPINKQAGLATPFWLHVCTYVLFYVGWEFHFRGFLQFGLAESMGRTHAVLIQVMASSLLHIGRPVTETIAAVGAGMLWGWLAYRTNSILSGMLQHILVGVIVDAAIVFS